MAAPTSFGLDHGNRLLDPGDEGGVLIGTSEKAESTWPPTTVATRSCCNRLRLKSLHSSLGSRYFCCFE
jgi:hypothetical protein